MIPSISLEVLINLNDITYFIKDHPIITFPLFLSFTRMRVVSTIGIFKNRAWGFYIGMISLILTILITLNFVPIGFLELLFCSIIVVLLVIGYLEENPIITS